MTRTEPLQPCLCALLPDGTSRGWPLPPPPVHSVWLGWSSLHRVLGLDSCCLLRLNNAGGACPTLLSPRSNGRGAPQGLEPGGREQAGRTWGGAMHLATSCQRTGGTCREGRLPLPAPASEALGTDGRLLA